MKDIQYLYGWWGSTLKVQIQLSGNAMQICTIVAGFKT